MCDMSKRFATNVKVVGPLPRLSAAGRCRRLRHFVAEMINVVPSPVLMPVASQVMGNDDKSALRSLPSAQGCCLGRLSKARCDRLKCSLVDEAAKTRSSSAQSLARGQPFASNDRRLPAKRESGEIDIAHLAACGRPPCGLAMRVSPLRAPIRQGPSCLGWKGALISRSRFGAAGERPEPSNWPRPG